MKIFLTNTTVLGIRNGTHSFVVCLHPRSSFSPEFFVCFCFPGSVVVTDDDYNTGRRENFIMPIFFSSSRTLACSLKISRIDTATSRTNLEASIELQSNTSMKQKNCANLFMLLTRMSTNIY